MPPLPFKLLLTQDFTTFIADDVVRLGIIQRRNQISTLVLFVHLEVDILKVLEVRVDRIRCNIFARHLALLLFRGKSPTLFSHMPVDGCEWNDVLESLQSADDQDTVCPRTGI